MVRNGLVARERLVLARRVRQHQRVAVLLVAEVVGDALQLQQAADKVQTALLVLHAVLPDAVAAGKALFHVHPAFTQQRFHYLRHRLPLEDAQVAVALHRPQVRLHRQLIGGITRAGELHRAHRHAGHLAVKVARRHQRLGRDGHRHRLPQQRAAVGPRVGAEQRQGEHERLRQRLAPGEFPEKQPLDRELNGDSVEHSLHSIMSYAIACVAAKQKGRKPAASEMISPA